MSIGLIGINDYDCEGVLTINSITLNQLWVCALDLTRLLIEVDKRGRNRIIPGAAGVVDLPVRNTETRHNLGLLVVGNPAHGGGAVTDARQTLVDNLEYLYDNVINQSATLAATFAPVGMTTRTANVQVLGAHEQRKYLSTRFSYWRGTLEINIPGGRFE